MILWVRSPNCHIFVHLPSNKDKGEAICFSSLYSCQTDSFLPLPKSASHLLWKLCRCPAQKLWSPALTTGALWTPRLHTHVCTHSHVHGHTHAPLQSTHSDFHLRVQVLLVVWVSGRLSGSHFASVASRSQWLPL